MAEPDEKPAKKMPRGRPFTKENAKEFSVTANNAKRVRAEMRRKMLQVAIDAGIDKYYASALKTGDDKHMAVVEKAMKLVGLDFAQSEDSVQRIDAKVDANVKAKADTTLNITFKDASST